MEKRGKEMGGGLMGSGEDFRRGDGVRAMMQRKRNRDEISGKLSSRMC